MLEKIDTHRTIAKDEYRKQMPRLQGRLFELQRACWEAGIAVVVVLEGWGTSGKGAIIKKLTERLEPRAFEIHAMFAPRTHELPLPWLYRFWKRLPAYGRMAVFDHGWHQVVGDGYVDGSLSDADRVRRFEDINAFERALADDRYVVIKFFLHITEEEQARRIEKLESDEDTEWRIGDRDREEHRSYGAHLVAFEEILARTETEWAPWTILAAHDQRWARVQLFETLIARFEGELVGRGADPVTVEAEAGAGAGAGAGSHDAG
jgi:polyphosphate kinase 2 (PPK2 family)